MAERYDVDHKLAPGPISPTSSAAEKKNRAQFLQFCELGPAEGYRMVYSVFFKTFMKSEKDWPLAEIAPGIKAWKEGYAAQMIAQLRDGRPYLLGEEFSLADCVASFDIMTATYTGVSELLADPILRSYADRLQKRESYQEVYKP